MDSYVELDGMAKKHGITRDMVDPKTMELGEKIEMEHTSNPRIARRIALDHIAEYGEEYYTELVKMEKRLKNRKLVTIGDGYRLPH